MKVLIASVLTLVLTLGGVYGVNRWLASRPGAGTDVTPVRVEPVRRGDLVESVSATGEIEPRTKVSISARVAARISELPHDEGAEVTAGNPNASPPVPPSVLVRFDAKDLEAALSSAQARQAAQAAEIKVAEARIEAQAATLEASRIMFADAERDLRRQQQLLTSSDVSQSVYDQTQAKADQMRAQLAAAEHSLAADRANVFVLRHNLEAADADVAQAREDLSYTTITSPIDGVVTKVNTEVGELAVTGTMNNAGTVLMEVGDLSKMLLVAEVDESSIAPVRVGQRAIVRAQAYEEQAFGGVVEKVALAQTEDEEANTKYFEVEILLETNGRRVLSGLTADAEIETQRHAGVLKVPSQAVLGRAIDALPQDLQARPEVDRTKTFATVVYRSVDGKAVATPVTVGASDVTHTVIRAGLAENDVVIVGPYKVLEALAHDQKVKEEQAPAPPAPATSPAATQAVAKGA